MANPKLTLFTRSYVENWCASDSPEAAATWRPSGAGAGDGGGGDLPAGVVDLEIEVMRSKLAEAEDRVRALLGSRAS